jgi:hypothetical protein
MFGGVVGQHPIFYVGCNQMAPSNGYLLCSSSTITPQHITEQSQLPGLWAAAISVVSDIASPLRGVQDK